MSKQATKDEFKVLMKIDHCWLSQLCKRYSLTAEVLKSYNDSDREYMWEEVRLFLLKNFDDKNQYKEIINSVKEMDRIEDVRVIQSENGLIHLLAKVRKCPVYFMLERGVLNFSKEIVTSNGSISLKIRAKKRSHIHKVISRILRRHDDIELLSILKIRKDEELTVLQDRVVRMAWSLGYYDIPKKITIKEMSEILGISPATLHEILKRAERKIINKYVKTL